MFNQDTDAGVRGSIGRALGENKPAKEEKKEIIPLMIERLINREAYYLERKGIVQGLGYLLKPTDTIEIRELAEGLNDRSASVKKETAISLGRIKPKDEKDIEKELIEIATNPEEEEFVRKTFMSALREIINQKNEQDIREPLIEIATDPNKAEFVREASIKVLGEINRFRKH